uniref:5'-nucleotidase domain-containing protein 1 n=1 Tax=Stomoxys calcitrans TaxID=35570 RepID=A0A1I8P7Y6_STOCA
MSHLKEFHPLEYDIIGFDLDGTLLRFNLNNMVPLVYELLVKYLVERNYPPVFLEKNFDGDFLQKGLILDAERGNLLKLAVNGEILKAAHGTRFLRADEIEEIYGTTNTWDVAQDYIKDPLAAWNGPLSKKIRALVDYFNIAAFLVFAQAVDILDEKEDTPNKNNGLRKTDYSNVWPDILSGLVNLYSRNNFSNGESGYFKALKENPEKYILKTDHKVIQHLEDLRFAGKAVYLLTGSNIDFANFTASYALGTNWRDLFHCVISFALKPGFFYMQRNFLQNDNLVEIPCSEIALQDDLLSKGNSFSQGNWQQLKESLCKHILSIDVSDAHCLYFGDNLLQDVYAPYTKASMDSIAICEELLEYENGYEYRPIVHSSSWGSYFCVNEKFTLWSGIIANCSQLCIPNMDAIVDVPHQEKFLSRDVQRYASNLSNGQLVH